MFEPIDTPNYLIRAFRHDDAAAIFSYASDAETVRYMSFPRHQNISDSENAIRLFDEMIAKGSPFGIAIERKSDGKIMGSTGWLFEGEALAHTGWILHKDHRGQGVATEAVGAMFAEVFRRYPKLQAFEATIYHENFGSLALAKRLGMTWDGSMRKHVLPNPGTEPRELQVWRLTRPAEG